LHAIGKTDIGRVRSANQDFIYINNKNIGMLPNLYVIADGMGGHKAGEVASKIAVECFVSYINQKKILDHKENILDILVSAFSYANRAVCVKSRDNFNCAGMGTTLSACCVLDKKLYAIHVGDSRIYLINKFIKQISCDHSYVNDLVRSGKISLQEARTHPNRNIITRAIGTNDDVLADAFVTELQNENYFLICSDGLNSMLEDQEMLEIINSDLNLENKVMNLIDHANINGGLDNISVILGEINL